VNTKTTQTGGLSVEQKYRRSLRWNLVLGLIAAFLAIVVAAEMLPGESPASTDSDDTEHAEEMDFVRRDADDPMAIGDVDAPVVLSEFIDMRCPFCAVVSRDIMPKLIEEYVDTGKVRIEFHDLVFYGDQSEQAAVAARAAGEQDKYFEFVTAVYADAPERSHPDLPRKELIEFAKDADVPDIKQFTEDLDNKELTDEVKASMQQAQQLGVTSTPFFVVGNTSLSGAQPVDMFRDFLDEALEEAE